MMELYWAWYWLCAPFFPAAYTYVLGFEDYKQVYDNYDQDGPLFSRYVDF